jgi:hypothetical protein
MKFIIVAGVLSGLLLSGPCLAQSDRSNEVQQLQAGIESISRVQRVNAAKIISRSGLQDQVLYQKISEILKKGYTRKYEKDLSDEMSWMCKALAASGDLQHKDLLNEIAQKAPSTKLQRYARQSSELIEQYAERSKVLNSADSWDDQLSGEENRLVNMLKSNDVTLKRDAAKIIVRNFKTDEKVFGAVASALKELSEKAKSDSVSIDTMAWLCKALAASGNNKYLEDLESVRAKTQSVKLQTYTAKAIKALK